MKHLFIILFLLGSTRGYCEKIDSLLKDINQAPQSWNNVRTAIIKYSNNNNNDSKRFYGDRLFLDASVYWDSYFSEGKEFTTVGDINVVHTDDKVLYLLITCTNKHNKKIYISRNDTLFQFVNEQYLSNVLYPHNSKNNTNYTGKDLLQDGVLEFNSGRGMSPEYDRIFMEVVPYITERDYQAIRQLRLSLNPTRQAYAAAALAAIKLEGTILPAPENEWLEIMRCSSTKIHYVTGCFGSYEELSYLLSDKMMLRFYENVKECQRRRYK